jgi:hypothetical protein
MRKLDIPLKPARPYILLILLALIGSIVIVLTLPLSGWLKILLLTLVSGYSWQSIVNKALLLDANAILRLTHTADRWEIHTRREILPVKICGDSTLTGFLSVLLFQVEGQRKKVTCVIFKASVGTDTYRRLCGAARTAAIA